MNFVMLKSILLCFIYTSTCFNERDIKWIRAGRKHARFIDKFPVSSKPCDIFRCDVTDETLFSSILVIQGIGRISKRIRLISVDKRKLNIILS